MTEPLKMIVCRTIIYKVVGGAWIDITDRLSPQPHITDIESYGAMATFGIVNNVNIPERNLLDQRCNRWSDGSTGPIDTGMFVSFRREVRRPSDGEMVLEESSAISYQMISSVEPSDDILSITSIDALQVLRTTGSEYFRDHYGSGGITTMKTTGNYANNVLSINKPAEAQLLGGAAGDVKWAVAVPKQFTQNPEGGSSHSMNGGSSGSYLNNTMYIMSEFVPDLKLINRLTIRTASTQASAPPHYTLRLLDDALNILYEVVDSPVTNWTTKTYTFSPIELDTNRKYWVQIISNDWQTMVATGSKSYGQLTRTRYITRTGTGSTGNPYVHHVNETADFFIVCILDMLEYRNASGSQNPTNPLLWNVTSIDSTTIDSSINDPSFNGRALISFASATIATNLNNIFSDIVLASGFIPNIPTSSAGAKVTIFRCSGDYYHNYLLALSEIKEEGGMYNGQRHVISADAESWSLVRLGIRHTVNDAPLKALWYAGDYGGAIVGGPNVSYPTQVMMSFTPKITRRHRPSTAMVLTTAENDQPIMVCLRDPNVKYGESVLSLDNPSGEHVNAAFSAYQNIMKNRSTDWEGEIKLSGIHTEYLDGGDYLGSGIPIRIFDSRYGMNNYPARVRQVDYNFRDLTTTLLINNNRIGTMEYDINTEKMAFSAGPLSVAATTPEQLNRQFLFVELNANQAPILPSNNRVWIRLQGAVNPEKDMIATTIEIGDLRSALLIAYFPVSETIATPQSHGVVAVRVNSGPWIELPEYRRVDKYYYQSLTVNIQVNNI